MSAEERAQCEVVLERSADVFRALYRLVDLVEKEDGADILHVRHEAAVIRDWAEDFLRATL